MLPCAAAEGGQAALGDRRRTARLVQVVDRLAAAPTASVPQACDGDAAAIKAAYRFWDNPAVTPAAIRAAHVAMTVERAAAFPLILAIQDSTELNFTAHPATRGLGPLAGPGQRGILVHSTLAVSPDGVPLGLLDQEQWTRDPAQAGSRHRRRQRTTAEKESSRWIRAQEHTQQALPETVGVLTIADREADLFDLLAAPRRATAHLLIRATHNRRVVTEDEAAYLWTTLAAGPPDGTHTVHVGRAGTRPERDARLTIRFAPVLLRPPRHQKGGGTRAPIPLVAILATEEQPPADQPAIVWRLLTSWPVETLDDVLGLIEAYTYRWLIERYHVVLKSGCRVEELQLQTAERLERAFATYCLVAWRLLWLLYEARAEPTGSGDGLLSATERAVLAAKVPSLPAEPTIRDVVRAVAKLGGFIGRASDGEPGVITLWRGLQTLHWLAMGWELHAALTADPLTRSG